MRRDLCCDGANSFIVVIGYLNSGNAMMVPVQYSTRTVYLENTI